MIARHFAAVSADPADGGDFGIDAEHMFEFCDWGRGRHSVGGAVGLSLMSAIGPNDFTELLAGFRSADEHFRTTPVERNIPALMGLLSVWYNTFLGAQTQAVLPYSRYLTHLPAFLQQLEMENNGTRLPVAAAPPDSGDERSLGQTGFADQLALYELLHHGTNNLIPCDFIGVATSTCGGDDQQGLSVATAIAQAEALAFGRRSGEGEGAGHPAGPIRHRVGDGNRPSTTLLLAELTPRSLGTLIAFYECRVFTESVLWSMDPFEQWDVGSDSLAVCRNSDEISHEISDAAAPRLGHDGSTNALIRCCRALRGQHTSSTTGADGVPADSGPRP